MYRGMIGQLAQGACLEPAVPYVNIVERYGLPRDSH
jgi:dihydroxy-acid dehydratase